MAGSGVQVRPQVLRLCPPLRGRALLPGSQARPLGGATTSWVRECATRVLPGPCFYFSVKSVIRLTFFNILSKVEPATGGSRGINPAGGLRDGKKAARLSVLRLSVSRERADRDGADQPGVLGQVPGLWGDLFVLADGVASGYPGSARPAVRPRQGEGESVEASGVGPGRLSLSPVSLVVGARGVRVRAFLALDFFIKLG